jgi:purine nucleoside phosphorylase
MTQALVGVIGGSGLYQMDALQNVQEVQVPTPFGNTSDSIMCGTVHGVPVAFWHGTGVATASSRQRCLTAPMCTHSNSWG